MAFFQEHLLNTAFVTLGTLSDICCDAFRHFYSQQRSGLYFYALWRNNLFASDSILSLPESRQSLSITRNDQLFSWVHA